MHPFLLNEPLANIFHSVFHSNRKIVPATRYHGYPNRPRVHLVRRRNGPHSCRLRRHRPHRHVPQRDTEATGMPSVLEGDGHCVGGRAPGQEVDEPICRRNREQRHARAPHRKKVGRGRGKEKQAAVGMWRGCGGAHPSAGDVCPVS